MRHAPSHRWRAVAVGITALLLAAGGFAAWLHPSMQFRLLGAAMFCG